MDIAAHKNKTLQEYKRKLKYIADNAGDIDYSWFNKHSKIIWVDDYQYDTKFKLYRQGFLSMDRKGKFIFLFKTANDPKELYQNLSNDTNCPCSENIHDFDGTDFDWLYYNVSYYGMLWRINRIYFELTTPIECRSCP